MKFFPCTVRDYLCGSLRLLCVLCVTYYSAFRIPHSAFAQEAAPAPGVIPSPSPTPAKDAEWDAGAGLSAYNAEVKNGCWYPVWVEVRALSTPVRGKATITQEYNSLSVEIPIDVAKGAHKVYRSAYLIQTPESPMSQAPLDVKLTAEPLGSESITINLRFAQRGDRHILALCEQPGAFNFLNRDASAHTRGAANALGRQVVIYSDPAMLPDDPVPLQSLDAVIIDTPQVRRITATQWSALRAWLAQGGQMLLAAGRQQPFIQESPLRNPCGVALRPPEPARWSDVLSGTLVRDSDNTLTADTFLAAWPEPPPGGWDDVRIGSETRPFLAGKRYGHGWFYLCAASLDPPVTAAFTSQLLNPNDLLPIEQTAPPGPLAELLQWGERDLGLTLQSGFAVTLAGVRWVLIYLLAYNLIAIPLNWWFCRRLRRPGLFWPLLIVFAAGFAWYGYKSGAERQQQNFQVNELTLISRYAPGVPARALSLTTLFTPRRINGDLPATGRVYLNRLALADHEELEPITVGFDPVAGLRRAVVYPWSVINLRAQFAIADPGGIELSRPIERRGMTFQDDGPLIITNRTIHRFDKWWLSRGKNIWTGKEPLDPGTSQTLMSIEPQSGISSVLLWKNLHEAFTREALSDQNLLDMLPSNTGFAADPETIYFAGMAQGVASPFAMSFLSQKTLGFVLYEQPLPMSAPPISETRWEESRWTARVTHIGDKPVSNQDEGLLNPGGATIRFPLNSVMAEFVPAEPLRRNQVPPRTLYFSYTFANYPDPRASWRDESSNPRQYRMKTCPQEVFNFKTRTWTGTLAPTLRLEPAADYLSPRSSVVLRFKAEPDAVYYSDAQGSGMGRGVITGRQLFSRVFGIQLPMEVSDMRNGPRPMPWMGVAPSQNPPVAAQLINISLLTPSTTNPAKFIPIPFGGERP